LTTSILLTGQALSPSHTPINPALPADSGLSNIVQEANTTERRMTLFPTRDDWTEARRAGGLVTSSHEDMHGGELEVSMLLHAHPEFVQSGYETTDHEFQARPHFLILGMGGYTPNGIIGKPSLASADKGKAVLDSLVRSLSQHLWALGTAVQ